MTRINNFIHTFIVDTAAGINTAMLFIPEINTPGKAGGIFYAGEALCYQPRLMRRWYGLPLFA